MRESCFNGVGEVVSLFTDHSVEETIVLCKQMPDISAEEICRISASWGFSTQPAHKKDAPRVCAGLNQEIIEKCAK